MKKDNLARHIHAFLQTYLPLHKGYSRHTVLSYRDTIKLLLVYSAARKKKSVTKLLLDDLGQDMVTDFLDHLEKQRGNSRQTRNIRLACLRSFSRFLARQDPMIMDQCQRILAIPFKRVKIRSIECLEKKEVEAILKAVDRSRPEGFRDYTLLSFMYNTGARVEETFRLTPRSFQLEKPYQVHFLGKGDKERICPLWPETATLIRSLMKQKGLGPQSDAAIFTNYRGEALTRHGVRYLLNKYVRKAAARCSSLRGKPIHPHSIRHTTATHMLSAGVDINSIRAWLGHSNLETTNRYAEINLDMKRKILEKHQPVTKASRIWKKNSDILRWLESL